MNRVKIGVDEADRDCFQLLRSKRPEQRARFVRIEHLLDGAIPQNTFAEFEPKPARHQRGTAYPIGILYVRPPFASHFEIVAEAPGRNQGGWRRVALNDG